MNSLELRLRFFCLGFGGLVSTIASEVSEAKRLVRSVNEPVRPPNNRSSTPNNRSSTPNFQKHLRLRQFPIRIPQFAVQTHSLDPANSSFLPTLWSFPI